MNTITVLDLTLSEKLCAVPSFVCKLTHLKTLKLNNLLMNTVPPSVKKKGEKEILSYFRDLSGDEQVAYHSAKVMVLGKEGVGKVGVEKMGRFSFLRMLCFFFL